MRDHETQPRHRYASRLAWRVTRWGALILLAACASAAPRQGSGSSATTSPQAGPSLDWSIKVREHVDLWLHGYAVLLDDTASIPYFRRGYRDEIVGQKNRLNLTTQLDANTARLRARFGASSALFGSQFLALYFGSWEDLQRGADLFLRADGDPRRASDPTVREVIAIFAGNFPAAADRDWLRLFLTSLQDESQKFYHAYWVEQRRTREPALVAADSLWRTVYFSKFRRFLNGTRQTRGDFLLSLPLDGEGRTVASDPMASSYTGTAIAVGFPESAAAAPEAIYAFAHEIAGALALSVVADNTTPAEQRNGVRDRYLGALQVRGGGFLLSRIAPEVADGYATYYLRSAGLTAPTTSPQTALAAAFPLPDPIRDAFLRQLDVILGGI